jgi:hypothetical protein
MPKNIVELEVAGILCTTEGLLVLATTFPDLRQVTLRNVGSFGAHGTTFEVARAFFVNKRMEMVRLEGYNDSTDPYKLAHLIRKFSPNGQVENVLEVEYPSSKITCIDSTPGLCCCRHLTLNPTYVS